jgi:hypothetical protein
MATVYSQDWSAGNSTFTGTDTYERAVDGPDALYPEIKYAESVTITAGKLDWNGTFGNYQTSGIMLKDFATFDGATGSISATYRPNSTSMGVMFTAPLIYVISSTGFGGERVLQLEANAVTGPGAPFTLDFTAFGWSGNYTVSDAFTFAADTDYTFKICWKTGTVTGDFVSVAADGYVRVYVNDVLVYEHTDFAFYIDYLNNNHVTKVAFGQDTDNDDGAGLFGTLDNIVFSDSACPEPTTPIIGSLVAGVKTTVNVTRGIAFGLDDNTNVLSEVGKFKVFGNAEITGDLTVGGSTLVSSGSVSTALDGLGT